MEKSKLKEKVEALTAAVDERNRAENLLRNPYLEENQLKQAVEHYQSAHLAVEKARKEIMQ